MIEFFIVWLVLGVFGSWLQVYVWWYRMLHHDVTITELLAGILQVVIGPASVAVAATCILITYTSDRRGHWIILKAKDNQKQRK